ncbi:MULTISPECIES: SDR family NAD(P)-dependent oxidoreductase [unclassified Paraburkholderia]|uniref:SDR family NAD(P)-dependent oxidoreductase n=1 Tax=unclassified Paraburkholderia TaxID=2615204 RepID=UPI001607F393|nr:MULTISPECIES: SDR family NAD(P)-dependent oxidoreductase [unclassified Paraburkholderia]MBB5442401.1 NAD(P)-dependent dehydrogenase (short-subunit alcohol dehydrogenase family) [Paraburkholderia sp. WSM4177]MBB5482791.1 NAD(P)-dependent dehydrogenase (short-subunit alcohol dehydrogenase family) [Paraburkholderia sp. WSM4180]
MISNQQDLSGKIAVVTGAGRGLGVAIADVLADRGAHVIVNDRTLEPATEAAKNIQRRGGSASAIAFDVADTSQVEDAFRRLLADHGRVDILINNAGIGDFVSFPEISSEKWDRMINIHLKGSFLCCQAVLASMKAQKYGKIVNVSSVAGKRGDFSGNAHYTAAKAGIIGLTKSLARYAAPFGINVNAIAPGLVATELTDEMSPEMKATTISNIPAGRLGRPEEIARAAAFLVSDDASYIFGETLSVNGGSYMD